MNDPLEFKPLKIQGHMILQVISPISASSYSSCQSRWDRQCLVQKHKVTRQGHAIDSSWNELPDP